MYCSSCGKKQREKANFCSKCGNSIQVRSTVLEQLNTKQLKDLNRVRKSLIISFIAVYSFLILVMALRTYDPYYYVNFFPYGLLQLLTVISAISCAIFTFKLSGILRKQTFIIIIYTILAPFMLVNFISLIGLLADSKKLNYISYKNESI